MNSSKEKKPGAVSSFLLKLLTDRESNFEILGDFEEIYYSVLKEKGVREAGKWYRKQLLRSAPQLIKSRITGGASMWSNHIKTSFRSILKNRAVNLLNITGLIIGITCAMLIMLWVTDELSYDSWHKDSDRIFRIDSIMNYSGKKSVWSSTPAPLGRELKKTYPEVEAAATISRVYLPYIKCSSKKFFQYGVSLAPPSLFDIFSFKYIKGSPSTALKDKQSIVITEKVAETLFGETNPLDRIITLSDKYNFKVAAVIGNPPHNTHIKFDILIHEDCYPMFSSNEHPWGRYDFLNFIRLRKDTSPSEFQEKIRFFIKRFRKSSTEFKLLPLKEVHLNPDNGRGNTTYLYIFSIIGALILIIACINFINLSTAGSSVREKEIGVRKVMGASRKNLIAQIFTESLLLAIGSYTISLVITISTLPAFNSFTGKKLSIYSLMNSEFILIQIAILLLTALLSGSYPALILSSIEPVKTLKAWVSTGREGSLLRKSLIIVQFSISVILIITTLNIGNQLDFLRNKELGFKKENLLYLYINSRDISKVRTVRDSLSALPEIKNCSAMSRTPVNMGNFTMISMWEGKEDRRTVKFNVLAGDEHCIDTMGIKLLKGKNFTTSSGDSDILINEKAVKEMGITSPVGKKLKMWGDMRTIVGVIRDFHFKPLNQKIGPVIIRFNNLKSSSYLFLRANPGNIAEIIKKTEITYRESIPESPFRFSFIDDALNRLYRNEQRTGTLINIFSVLAILTSCLGLFGLSAFTARRRIKEIGIRKVLGAGIPGLVMKLSKDFVILILISNLIAWPLAWSIVSGWLADYAYKADISLISFLTAAAAALLTGIVTISYHTLSAASSNPVKCIKDE